MKPDLLEVFDRICIINLADRADRRKAITRELRRQGVEVDGDRVRFVQAIRPDSPGSFPSVGARGCFLSHLKVLRRAQEDGVRRLLVLEDDVMFTGALRGAAPLATALRQEEWSIAYAGHARTWLPGPLRWERTQAPIVCAHCVAFSQEALPVVVAHLEACLRRPVGHPEGGPMHYDGALTVLRRLRPDLTTLMASRSLARQRSSRSDIIGPSWLDDWPGAAWVRAARNGWRRVVGAV